MIKLVVFGTPAPQGSKRMVGRTKKGIAILVESSPDVDHWRSSVQAAGIEAMNRDRLQPLDGPLLARMIFTLKKPKSAPKRTRSWPIGPPDLDKLARSTGDALKMGGVIVDDSRIVGFTRLWKCYPQEDPEALIAPGARIEIMPLTE